MPGFNPDKINIHDLTIEESESTASLPFNPEADIGKSDFEKIKKSFNEYLSADVNVHYLHDDQPLLEVASGLKILLPEKMQEFDLEKVWDRIKYSCQDNQSAPFFLKQVLTAAKILFPERIGELTWTNKDWQEIIRLLGRYKSDALESNGSRGVIDFISIAADLRIFLPEKADELRNEDIAKMAEEKFKERSYKNYNLIGAEYISKFKILFPERMENLGLGKEFWKKMKSDLHEESYGRWVAKRGAALKIIAAEKVEITDNGLELTMPQKLFVKEVSRMPEKKQF